MTRSAQPLAAILVALVLLGACGSEGRTLRPPPDGSVFPPPSVATEGADEAASGANPEGATTEAITAFKRGLEGFEVSSQAIEWGGEMPPAFLCQASTVAPPLDWRQVPTSTLELAIVVSDVTGEVPIHHWIVAGLSPQTARLGSLELPETAAQALNDTGELGWSAPCLTEGATKVIRFSVYALRAPSGVVDRTASADAVAAIEAQSISDAFFTATITG